MGQRSATQSQHDQRESRTNARGSSVSRRLETWATLLIPCAGFYEWQAVEGQKTKQPWFIKSKGDDLLVMAGLWDRSPTDGDMLESTTIITVPANELLTEIHKPKNRMPLILGADQWEQWLGGDAVDSLVQTLPDGLLDAWPVGTYVNGPKHDDSRCLEKVNAEPAQPGLFGSAGSFDGQV